MIRVTERTKSKATQHSYKVKNSEKIYKRKEDVQEAECRSGELHSKGRNRNYGQGKNGGKEMSDQHYEEKQIDIQESKRQRLQRK